MAAGALVLSHRAELREWESDRTRVLRG